MVVLLDMSDALFGVVCNNIGVIYVWWISSGPWTVPL
jgi:hypothetical protein